MEQDSSPNQPVSTGSTCEEKLFRIFRANAPPRAPRGALFSTMIPEAFPCAYCPCQPSVKNDMRGKVAGCATQFRTSHEVLVSYTSSKDGCPRFNGLPGSPSDSRANWMSSWSWGWIFLYSSVLSTGSVSLINHLSIKVGGVSPGVPGHLQTGMLMLCVQIFYRSYKKHTFNTFLKHGFWEFG